MAALTHTFISNTIAVGQKHTAPAPSTAPILGARRNGPLIQVTRGNGKWELWDTYDDQDILDPNSSVITLKNSVTSLQVKYDFSYGTGVFTNSPFAVSTDLVTWTSPTWTDPTTNNTGFIGLNNNRINHTAPCAVVLYDKFILVRTKDILTSSDGVNWTSFTLPNWPYFSNYPGQNNGGYDLVESLEAVSGNKLQIFISTFIGYGYLANGYQTNMLESSDYGVTWALKTSFYGYNQQGYVNILSAQDSNFPNTSLHGSPDIGEIHQIAYDSVNNVITVVEINNGAGVIVLRSYDSGNSWYSNYNTNANLFELFRNVSGHDVGTVPFTLVSGGGYYLAYMNSYPAFGNVGAWFYISGNDWTNGSGGYATWTKITVNGNAQPNWMNANVKPVFDGTNWIFKDSWRGLQSTDLTTWTAIPMKPKLAANTEGETFFGED
jgi:hypothetical protein